MLISKFSFNYIVQLGECLFGPESQKLWAKTPTTGPPLTQMTLQNGGHIRQEAQSRPSWPSWPSGLASKPATTAWLGLGLGLGSGLTSACWLEHRDWQTTMGMMTIAMIMMMGGTVAAADSDDCQEQLKSNSSLGGLRFFTAANAAAHGQWTIYPSVHLAIHPSIGLVPDVSCRPVRPNATAEFMDVAKGIEIAKPRRY